MNRIAALKASVAVIAMLALAAAHASIMSTADYKVGKARIAAGHKADKAACAELRGRPRGLCFEVATGKQKVARAELDYIYTGKPADRDKVALAKAAADHAVARERCVGRTGDDQDLCIRAAKVVLMRALADARTARQVDALERRAVRVPRGNGFRGPTESCDALSGDARADCRQSVTEEFGKT